MKPRHLLLAAGLVAAGWPAFFGDKTPAGGIAEPLVRAPGLAEKPAQSPRAASPASARTAPAVDILVLRSREELIGGARAAADAGALFSNQSWTPPPPPPKPAPPPPPTAPPLPFTYLGKKIEGGAWEVYLARGDQTYILREQSVVDGTYRVESIKPPTLSITYMPLNQMQTLTIGGAD
ncbi:MAG TPA: hypothetical protein VEC06_19595 [Paucimonas sp.]|nr:hypothetical protein [Paucimonas sp.]